MFGQGFGFALEGRWARHAKRHDAAGSFKDRRVWTAPTPLQASRPRGTTVPDRRSRPRSRNTPEMGARGIGDGLGDREPLLGDQVEPPWW